MSNIVKANTKQEAIREMVMIDRSIANTTARLLEIEEEKKKITTQWKATKEFKRLKELGKEEKKLIIKRHEINGARKFCYALLKKFGIEPQTKLTRLAENNDTVKELIGA